MNNCGYENFIYTGKTNRRGSTSVIEFLAALIVFVKEVIRTEAFSAAYTVTSVITALGIVGGIELELINPESGAFWAVIIMLSSVFTGVRFIKTKRK